MFGFVVESSVWGSWRQQWRRGRREGSVDDTHLEGEDVLRLGEDREEDLPLLLEAHAPLLALPWSEEGKKRREDVTQHASSRPSGADATSTGPSQETYHDGRFPARLKNRPPLPSPPAASSQVKSLSTPSPRGDRSTLFVLLVSRPPTAEDPNFGRGGVGSSRRAVGVYETRQQLRGPRRSDQTSGRFQAQGGEERLS